MALTGVHILCTSVRMLRGSSLIGTGVWSETLSATGTTTNTVQSNENVLQISAAVDAFVSVGKTPDPTQAVGNDSNTARIFISAGVTMPVFCTAGDKVAFTPA